jgi:hypothetical protein
MLSLSEIRSKEAEERLYDMQYKISYLIWKIKPAWALVDMVALYFNFGIAMAIVALALYFQIAFIWLVYLSLYLV